MQDVLRSVLRKLTSPIRRFHRDERGDALEYALVLLVFALPIVALMDTLKDILRDYFSMIAFYVGWPFL